MNKQIKYLALGLGTAALLAAGLAPAYSHFPLDAPQLEPAREAYRDSLRDAQQRAAGGGVGAGNGGYGQEEDEDEEDE
jgi:hypothetical protein